MRFTAKQLKDAKQKAVVGATAGHAADLKTSTRRNWRWGLAVGWVTGLVFAYHWPQDVRRLGDTLRDRVVHPAVAALTTRGQS